MYVKHAPLGLKIRLTSSLDLAGVLHEVPPSIKRLSIYENIDNFSEWEDDELIEDQEARLLNHGLRRLSLQLEEFALSNLIDAEDFFRPFSEPDVGIRLRPGVRLPLWKHLRWLTLTSKTITETADAPVPGAENVEQDGQDGFMDDAVNDLLHTAGKAAKRMPQLEVMELYSADTLSAGVFCYMVSSGRPSISWRGTWAFRLSEKVKRVWEEVAQLSTGYNLDITPEHFIDYRGPAKFIHQNLATRELVLDPTSSQDMLKKQALPEPFLKLPLLRRDNGARLGLCDDLNDRESVDRAAPQLQNHDYYRLRSAADAEEISSLLESFGWTKKGK